MDTLISVIIAVVVSLFFVRGYLKKLTAKAAPRAAAAPAPVAMHPCPRCSQPIPKTSSFCSHCGAALAMWTVHRAEITTSSGDAKGKPKPVINASLCVGCGGCIEVCPEVGAMELIQGKAILTHPELCTGHAKCAEACPTNAIAYAYDGVLQTVKVPNVKEDFETNVSGLYIVGELGGMGLIKTAINEGKLAIDYVRQRLQAETGKSGAPDDAFDVAIVGAGPAGLSASLSAHQYDLHYITLEQGEIASTIRNYPRHKFLMAEPLSIPLYGNLYIADSSKEALLAVWETIVQNTGVRIQTNERLERVQRNGSGFHVESSKRKYYARYVVLALGRRGSARKLSVPGEELSKVAHRLIEAETYEDKNVLVVGGGDSAIEAAIALGRAGKNRVTLSYRGADFKRARERNQHFLEAAEKEGKLRVVRRSNLVEILPASVAIDVQGAREEIPNDYVFILIGGESPEEFLTKMGVEIVEKSLQPTPTFS